MYKNVKKNLLQIYTPTIANPHTHGAGKRRARAYHETFTILTAEFVNPWRTPLNSHHLCLSSLFVSLGLSVSSFFYTMMAVTKLEKRFLYYVDVVVVVCCIPPLRREELHPLSSVLPLSKANCNKMPLSNALREMFSIYYLQHSRQFFVCNVTKNHLHTKNVKILEIKKAVLRQKTFVATLDSKS